jgi:hypothetical protein
MSTLLIDDIRNLPADAVARTYDAGIALLKSQKWNILLLDHDLGDYKDGKERTGYDILCWLEEHPEYLPGGIVIVTDNASAYSRMKLVRKKLYNEL